MNDFIRIAGLFTAGAAAAFAILKFYTEKSIEKRLQRALHRETLLTSTELEFRQKQLAEFYGPIYASLKLLGRMYPLWLDGRFKEVNLEIISLFKTHNEQIVEILKSKAHLIEGEEFPPAFTKYMTSVTIWNMYCARPGEPWLPPHVAEIEEVKWPKEFEDYIFNKTEELKQRLDGLLKKYQAT